MSTPKFSSTSSPTVFTDGDKTIDPFGGSATALYTALRPWQGKFAYVVPIADESGKLLGNNGDELLMKVFWHVVSQAGVKTVADIQSADVLLVPPSGSLLQMYAFPDLLRKYTSENMTAPMVIFPSSANFPTRDPAFLFDGRRSKTIWILREKYSYDHLRKAWGDSLSAVGCELLLDHDVVASHGSFVRELFGPVTSGRPLVGARKDVEQDSASNRPKEPSRRSDTKLLRSMRSAVVDKVTTHFPYGRAYTGLVRAVRMKAQRKAGANLITRLPEREQQAFEARRTVHRDVSSKHQATFDQYLMAIAGAGPVLTDRLHIALPAAILGKDVWLIEGGYHKARGVVERSLPEASNVRLIFPDRVGGE